MGFGHFPHCMHCLVFGLSMDFSCRIQWVSFCFGPTNLSQIPQQDICDLTSTIFNCFEIWNYNMLDFLQTASLWVYGVNRVSETFKRFHLEMKSNLWWSIFGHLFSCIYFYSVYRYNKIVVLVFANSPRVDTSVEWAAYWSFNSIVSMECVCWIYMHLVVGKGSCG